MASNEARVIPLRREAPGRDENAVVAVVLADGTVRRLDGSDRGEEADWTSGQITGSDWVVWWQRRSFAPR